MELTGRANAASWKGPTIDPLVIHPRSPCHYLNTRVIEKHKILVIGLASQGKVVNVTTEQVSTHYCTKRETDMPEIIRL